MIKYRLQQQGRVAYVSITGDGTTATNYRVASTNLSLKADIEAALIVAPDMHGHLLNEQVLGYELAGAMASAVMAPFDPLLVDGVIKKPRQLSKEINA